MQITFRYTNQEYVRFRRINKMLGMPRWKSFAIALLCLLPSLVLVIFTKSFIAIASLIIVAAFLLVLVAAAALRRPDLTDQHDHVMTFSDQSLHEKSSHSEYELKWEYFDELIENEHEFLLRRLERFVWLPKRVFTSEQIAEFRPLAAKLNKKPIENSSPLPLYDRVFLKSEQDPVRFFYDQEDLVSANIDPLRIIDTSRSQEKRKRPANNWLVAAWLTILLVVIFYVVRSPPGSDSSWDLFEFLLLAIVIILPFVLLIILSRIIRMRAAKNGPRTPPDEHQLVMLKNGFAVGTPKNVSLYDWRDVDAFYENKTCFGLKTFNDLVQVIPKRIFAEESAADHFLNQAISLQREYRRGFEPSAPAVETGNPYQPPSD